MCVPHRSNGQHGTITQTHNGCCCSWVQLCRCCSMQAGRHKTGTNKQPSPHRRKNRPAACLIFTSKWRSLSRVPLILRAHIGGAQHSTPKPERRCVRLYLAKPYTHHTHPTGHVSRALRIVRASGDQFLFHVFPQSNEDRKRYESPQSSTYRAEDRL